MRWPMMKVAMSRLVATLRAGRWPLLAAAGALVVLLLASRRYEDVRNYGVMVATGTLLFIVLLVVFSGFSGGVVRFVERLIRIPPVWLAVVFALLAVLAGRFILGDMPHVSDEVAYQFQARSMAMGRLAMPEPPVPEAFNFLHLMIADGKWYGIMNPGWPVLLAAGELAGLPWIINPILGAVAILCFAGFFREAGLEPKEKSLTLLLLATSPLLVFMSGTYMSHPANLLFFAIFCWAWARMLNRESLAAAAVAGVALGFNLLIRPIDTAAVTLPFIVQLLWHLRRRPRLLAHAAVVALMGSTGIGATLAYNQALTGNPLEMPVTQYFTDRNPQEKFGIGFGPDMGTKLHGKEWPGFTPMDAIKVSSYRLLQFLKDLYGLPLVVLAGLLVAIHPRLRPWGEWRLVLIAGGGTVIAIYFFHFYHGIAYGSRHYYLVAPALALILGRLGAEWLTSPRPERPGVAASGILALLATTVVFAVPPLIEEYGGEYRGVSPTLARAVRDAELHRALVFVEPGSWSWKAAFPLNHFPLEKAEVIFARDLGARNPEVISRFPARAVYYLRVGVNEAIQISRSRSDVR